ncbi:alkylation response protein AidB-like acyl-CoA dehydrogenase [Pedobacter cryoconitis]|uniref:Cyclohex-1-ene-1-carbonyl-CoA dehydrogenase n=1 Tax=Pedobacter cryoconitis TaxID=188932 RepID=A0A7W9DI45_9SPHI|nr:acyl-CoA dehydrogenase family protein [Pedobacter cryoconitis]MBB5619687.1 alkylation response protein AidB-like acyl-CoA dehydrogenase [Pedobacter cryoconitis]MBB5647830.1 alkylation response protein AidB-like acyl-CoA dehydrogenase [Pedobacter cryoconitis]
MQETLAQNTGFNFSTSENQLMIRSMVKDFAEKNIRPHVMEWDEAQTFPVEVFKKLGELGMMGVLVPEVYGGSGFGYQEYVDVIVEVARVCGSIGLSLAAHNSLCTGHILAFGTEEQKMKWLPKLATAEWIGAWGLTEANTGSDALRMMTTATLDGDHYVLNGAKNWITHGKSGDIAVVMVRTGEKGDSKGISAIVVERGTPGFSAGKKENKLGMRASETTEMIFDNCRVPVANLLGNVGEGFKQAMKVLDGGRISIAALSLGIAKGAYEAALAYAQERHQFGQPISSFQAISFKLADMATEIEAAELLIRQSADLKNRGQKMTKESAMAKYFASEVAVRAATEAVQIFGGYGYTKDFPVEKFYRDSKLCTIGEGTSEIQKIVIAREILNK